jgi:hypothetical protein
MRPPASKSSKLVGLLDALDASDGMDVATDVATAKNGGEPGFGGREALGFGGEPDSDGREGPCECLPDKSPRLGWRRRRCLRAGG